MYDNHDEMALKLLAMAKCFPFLAYDRFSQGIHVGKMKYA